MAVTICGRMSPASRSSTSRPSSSWPSERASAAQAAAKVSMSISLRSRRAQAFSSGLVALTRRMKPAGRPRSASRWANASKGLVEMTPPKSNITARIAIHAPSSAGPLWGPAHGRWSTGTTCNVRRRVWRGWGSREEGVMDLDLLDLYGRASDWTSTKVVGAASQLDDPTTCDGWDVRTLLNHMLQTQRYFV